MKSLTKPKTLKMKGVVRKIDILKHPIIIIRCYGFRIWWRGLTRSYCTFLDCIQDKT